MILTIFIYVVCAAYLVSNLRFDIQMLQQSSYRIERYWRWLQGNYSSAWRLIDLALLFLLFSTLLTPMFNMLIVGLAALTKLFIIFTRKYKKPLVFTKRVWRIYSVAAILSLSGFIVTAVLYNGNDLYPTHVVALGILLLEAFFSWAFVIAAVWLLSPVEKNINKKYYDDAANILHSMPDLKIIGITGSYGKTSTKHYLERILSEKYNVLMTPGSFNTTMGVIRTIREYLKPYNEVFICEMGAKQPGDVKEICDLVHPSIGIVTAVGPMHLETFKSIDNVQRTKFELVDSLPQDGLAVVNNDFEACANRKVDNVAISRYGVANTNGCDFIAEDIEYTPDGTSFTVKDKNGTPLRIHTRLLGECNISNLLAAVIVALELGVEPERIQYAIEDIEQVEHRLNVKRTPGGVNIIDDAFNSNPSGSKMAMEVLSHFKNGRRIVVTPGMVELGDKQFELNRNLGHHIADNVDIAIIVGHYNREALLAGLEDHGFPTDKTIIAESFADAQQKLGQLLKSGDTVLYENDLPDTFK